MGDIPTKKNNTTQYRINPEKFNPIEPSKPNPNRDYIRTLQDAQMIMNEIADYIGLDDGDWWYKRIDFAFDSEEDYENLYALNNCVMRTFAVIHKAHNNYRVIGGDSNKRSIKAVANRRALEIYDKRIETRKATGPCTRVEFRFSRLSEGKNKDPSLVMDAVMKDLEKEITELPTAFGAMEYAQASELYSQYVKYMKHKHAITSYGKAAEQEIASLFVPKTFRTFVLVRQDEVLTNNVLKAVYCKAGGKHFRQWKNANKEALGDIRLIEKKDVEHYCKVLKNCLEKYKSVTGFVTLGKNGEPENALTVWDYDDANSDSAIIDIERDSTTNREIAFQDRAERYIVSATGQVLDGGGNIGLYAACGVAPNDIAEYLSQHAN